MTALALAYIAGGLTGFLTFALCAAAGRDSDDITGAPEGADFRAVARAAEAAERMDADRR